MKIRQIYEKFSTPTFLRSHMLRVGMVAQFICDHWAEDGFDKDKVIRLALVHDLGNVVRLNLDLKNTYQTESIEYLRNLKEVTIVKYGDNDDEATKKMLKEIGVQEDFVRYIFLKQFARAIDIEESDDWLLKILLYSDMRVLPDRIGTLEERLDEAKNRRPDIRNRPNFNRLSEAVFKIESDIQFKITVPLSNITDNNVKSNDEELLEMDL